MSDRQRRRGGSFWLGTLAGILVGLVLVVVAFAVLRPGARPVASPSALPTEAPDTTTQASTPSMPTASPTATATVTPTPTVTPTSASPTPVAGLVTSLPAGSYIAVVGSMPKGPNTAEDAVARAAALARGGYQPRALDADRIPPLKGGFYAIAVTGLKDFEQVKQVCAAMGLSGNRCYPRKVG